MKKYIESWETAAIAETYLTENAVVYICTNDLHLPAGEAAEQKKEVINQMVHDILYRQAIKNSKNTFCDSN